MLFGGFLGQLILWVTLLQLDVHAATKGNKGKPTATAKPDPIAASSVSETDVTSASTAKNSDIATPSITSVNAAPSSKSCSLKRGLSKRTCAQEKGPWHLEWISQEDLKKVSWVDIKQYKEEVMVWNFNWRHDTDWGSNVIIYVLDSGVNGAHDAFITGQVETGAHVSRLNDDPESDAHIDKPGHGTGIASLIVGGINGIACKGIIYPIKIDNIGEETDDTNKDVTEAITIAVKNWKSRVAENPKLRAVINISWVVRHSAKVQAAIESAIEASMHVVISAGNAAANECYDDKNPKKAKTRVKSVGQIVVSSITPVLRGMEILGEYNSQSNYGPCVDIVTPGSAMWMAHVGHYHGYVEMDGTSFSAPIVAGTIAALLSSNAEYRDLNPADFKQKFLAEFGAKGVQNLPPDTPNRRLLIKKLVDSI